MCVYMCSAVDCFVLYYISLCFLHTHTHTHTSVCSRWGRELGVLQTALVLVVVHPVVFLTSCSDYVTSFTEPLSSPYSYTVIDVTPV